MKKLSLLFLCIISYTQTIHGMKENRIVPYKANNDDDYSFFNTFVIIKSPTCKRSVDRLSERLYNYCLTENEIEKLVKQGADVNYHSPQINFAVPVYYACNDSYQGLINMNKIIELGAHLHDFSRGIATPLTIAVRRNITPMIQLLLPYEKIETSTAEEVLVRSLIIDQSFAYQNLESIKLLLSLKLMTAHQGLKTFAKYMVPNKEIFDCLIDSGADNYDYDVILDDILSMALPNVNYIKCLKIFCSRKAFNKQALEKMYVIKALVDGTIHNLENAQITNLNSI